MYQKFDTYVLSLRSLRSESNNSAYFKTDNGHILIIVLYVDDMLFVGNDKSKISDLKSHFSTQFEMKDLGVVRYILGIEIIRDRANKKLWLSQRKYVKSMLERFNMTTCRQMVIPIVQGIKLFVEYYPKSPTEMEDMTRVHYVSAIGSLMYAMVCTRPEISQVVGVFSHFITNLGQVH